jgi:hypothetical protein
MENINQCTAINNNKKRCLFKCSENSEYCSRHIIKLNKPKKEIILCCAKNQKKEQCPWKAIDGEKYCKRHLEILGNNQSSDEKYCSGCKNYLPLSKWKDQSSKICSKCSDRCKINREKDKIKRIIVDNKCIGYTQSKIINNDNEIIYKKCDHYANKNSEYPEYCGEHQALAKKLNLETDIIKVCSNWIRGCFNTFEPIEIKGHRISKCITCREKARTKDLQKYNMKIENALKFNKETKDKELFMCHSCNSINDIKTVNCNKCIKCYEIQTKSENNRYINNPLLKRVNDVKKSKFHKNRIMDLTDDEIIELITQKCYYCNNDEGPSGIGIDRFDSTKDYIKDNCKPCCEMCNRMKSNYSFNDFTNIIKYLVRINKFVDKNPNEKYAQLFKRCKNPYFNILGKSSTDNKPKQVHIDNELWEKIIKSPCFYCKNNFNGNGAGGVDRVDSKFGYFESNIVPACSTCNLMKNIMLPHEFFNKIKKIYNKHIGFIDFEPTIRENILQELNTDINIKIADHIKFLKENHKEYENLIFMPKSLDDIKNIKILLEFCDLEDNEDNKYNENNKNNNDKHNMKKITDKQKLLKDIWKYFRYTVSSLKIEKHREFDGRRFYVLVKDQTTETYLGIMSLSKDMFDCRDRDSYIGWDKNEKREKYLHIMNLTTCVPLQPFGFNFNGGKLIAMLAFSKEISMHYKKRYINTNISDLLGIITTSIHGKSIMYDRLKCMKHIGFTQGNSTQRLSNKTIELCKNYCKNKKNYNDNINLKKLYYVEEVFKKFKIPKKHMESNPKGIYFGFTSPNSKEYLTGKTDTIPDLTHLKTSQEIFNEWLNRWGIQRYNQLKLKNNLKCNNLNKIDEYTLNDNIKSNSIIIDELNDINNNNNNLSELNNKNISKNKKNILS